MFYSIGPGENLFLLSLNQKKNQLYEEIEIEIQILFFQVSVLYNFANVREAIS